MATAYSLLQLRQALAEEAFAGQFPIRILTTGAGTTTTVVIGDLAFGAAGSTANAYHGVWLYNTAAVPVAPFSSRVLEQGGFTVASGTLTVAPPFGSAPGNAVEVIFCYDLHPDELARAINRVLRTLSYDAYLPVTLCPDGDLEDSGVTHWAAVGAPTTREKQTTNPFLIGRQTLHIAGGTGAGATSDNIPAIQGEPLLLSVPVQVVSGSAQIVLHDATAAATITAVTVDEEQPVTVQFLANAPSGCERVTVRPLCGAAGSEFYTGPVSVLSQNRRRYSLDTGSIERVADIKDVMKIPASQGAVAAESFYSFVNESNFNDFMIEEDVRAGSPMNIVLPSPSEPYFMRVQKRFPELTVTAATINAATNTTLADRDTVVQGAMFYLERARYARIVAANPALAATHLGRSREYARRFAMMRQAQGYGIVAREVSTPRTTVAMS